MRSDVLPYRGCPTLHNSFHCPVLWQPLLFHIRHCKSKVLTEPREDFPFLGEPQTNQQLGSQGVVTKVGLCFPKKGLAAWGTLQTRPAVSIQFQHPHIPIAKPPHFQREPEAASPLSWEEKPRQEARAALSLPPGLPSPLPLTATLRDSPVPVSPLPFPSCFHSFQHARSRVKVKGRRKGRNAIPALRSFQPEVQASHQGAGQLAREHRH